MKSDPKSEHSGFPLVSVITAVKNETLLLKNCLSSLLNQDYPHFEIIIVNDNSKDNTAKILDEYKSDPRIHVIHSKVDLGRSAARNRAIVEAKGKYIAIADSDDVFKRSRLSKQVKFLNSHREIDFLGTGFSISGQKSWRLFYAPKYVKTQLILRNSIVHSSLMIRSSAINTKEIYDPDMYLAEDYELYCRHILHHNFANIREKLVQYNKREYTDSERANMLNYTRTARQKAWNQLGWFPAKQVEYQFHLFAESDKRFEPSLFPEMRDEAIRNLGHYKMLKVNRILYSQLLLFCLENKVFPGFKSWINMTFQLFFTHPKAAYQCFKTLFF